MTDKLWFFLSFREWGTTTTRAGIVGARIPNLTPAGLFYHPGPDAPGVRSHLASQRVEPA